MFRNGNLPQPLLTCGENRIPVQEAATSKTRKSDEKPFLNSAVLRDCIQRKQDIKWHEIRQKGEAKTHNNREDITWQQRKVQ